jgi:hypothetical protein
MAYERELEWDEPPSQCERRYARWTVVRAAGVPATSWWPLARLGAVDLHLAPPGRERDAPTLSITPVIAAKRGRRGGSAYVGVDGQIQIDRIDQTDEQGDEMNGRQPAGDPAAPPPRPHPPLRSAAIDPDSIRVAVVDVTFDEIAALPAPIDGPMRVGLPSDRDDRDGPRPMGPGHGTQMAGVVLAECPGARVGLFQIAGVAGAARPYLAAADLAAAVGAAVGAWQADVVLVAMSDGAWGTPRYLRDILREAARCGRGGRGTPIFCSVGDPSRNHTRQDDSAALGADDLASQPWVQAIAACDARGRWYRVYPGYECPGAAQAAGATYNRFGPAVALAALGEPRRWSARIASDDSSQASAVAAAAAATVLGANRDLSAAELRALLALTADAPATVDDGRGLGAGAFDGRDRLGHNFKIGNGVVNAGAAALAAADPLCLALLATRVVPDDDPGSPSEAQARALARSWMLEVRRAAPGTEAARLYLRMAGRLTRLFLTSLAFQEALCWLARHLRALREGGRPALWQGQHHGALLERILHALETAWDALSPGEDETAAALQALEVALADPAAGTAVATFLARTLHPVDTPSNGGQGQPRAIALAGDSVGDRHRRRGAHGVDGDSDLERAPFERTSVSRAVYRSPR